MVRFRGVVPAAIAAAVAALGLAYVLLGGDAWSSPGPRSAPHRDAGVGCESCHREASPERACERCHDSDRFARDAHRALHRSGALTCTRCHPAHVGRPSFTFEPSGRARFSPDGQVELRLETDGYRPETTTHVPLVSVAACAGCHQTGDPNDPAAVCVAPDGDEWTRCFDEHERAGAGPQALERFAAWDAARAGLRDLPEPVADAGADAWRAWAVALGAGVCGLFVLGFASAFRRHNARRRVPAARRSLPVLVDKVRIPRIDANRCLGCYACVDACPYDVLAVERFTAVVVRPKDCCGLTLCEQVCPNGSLVVDEGEPLTDRPRVSEGLESLDRPGLFLAGDLTGAPLMRNAIHQGALAVQRLAEGLPKAPAGVHDLVIVGAGPAGLSAALEATRRGLNYVVVEQGSFARSIRSFPRGKLVFDQPMALGQAGALWLEECTKEELLAKWTRIVREHRLRIEEGHRVLRVNSPSGDRGVFVVCAERSDGESVDFAASRVLLAVGRRGTPRTLDVEVADGAVDHVHYALADARSFAGQTVVVVGLGDVAMEAAIALSKQPDTSVTVVHRGAGFSRGKARNVAEVQRLAASGALEVCFETRVTKVMESTLTIRTAAGERALQYDAVFVLIGSLPPWPFLEAAGVRRVGAEA